VRRWKAAGEARSVARLRGWVRNSAALRARRHSCPHEARSLAVRSGGGGGRVRLVLRLAWVRRAGNSAMVMHRVREVARLQLQMLCPPQARLLPTAENVVLRRGGRFRPALRLPWVRRAGFPATAMHRAREVARLQLQMLCPPQARLLPTENFVSWRRRIRRDRAERVRQRAVRGAACHGLDRIRSGALAAEHGTSDKSARRKNSVALTAQSVRCGKRGRVLLWAPSLRSARLGSSSAGDRRGW
jgi:hypothetical protein